MVAEFDNFLKEREIDQFFNTLPDKIGQNIL